MNKYDAYNFKVYANYRDDGIVSSGLLNLRVPAVARFSTPHDTIRSYYDLFFNSPVDGPADFMAPFVTQAVNRFFERFPEFSFDHPYNEDFEGCSFEICARNGDPGSREEILTVFLKALNNRLS